MMYFVHIAVFLGLIVVAAGFVAFHFANKERSSSLKAAAWILVIGGVLGLSCILYYSLRYWQQGYFEQPAAMMMHHRMNDNAGPKHDAPMQRPEGE